jgi:hypothetical protein
MSNPVMDDVVLTNRSTTSRVIILASYNSSLKRTTFDGHVVLSLLELCLPALFYYAKLGWPSHSRFYTKSTSSYFFAKRVPSLSGVCTSEGNKE